MSVRRGSEVWQHMLGTACSTLNNRTEWSATNSRNPLAGIECAAPTLPLRVGAVMLDDVSDSPIRSLSNLAQAEGACTRCPLYAFATQAVPGEGRVRSRIMLVGEQPGDKEDIAGKPFVGPAGRILDEALAQAGIPRGEAFVTNAVKHFKFEQRGKRRLHKRPNAYEIERCHWWLAHERKIVKPSAIVALGATAARSVLGRAVTITSVRGRALQLADVTAAFVTIHPSWLLRIRDEDDKRREYNNFIADLRLAARTLVDRAA